MGGIIDGRRWTKERIAHLEGVLADDEIDEEVRAGATAELDRLREDQHRGRARRWWRFLGGPRL